MTKPMTKRESSNLAAWFRQKDWIKNCGETLSGYIRHYGKKDTYWIMLAKHPNKRMYLDVRNEFSENKDSAFLFRSEEEAVTFAASLKKRTSVIEELECGFEIIIAPAWFGEGGAAIYEADTQALRALESR